MISALATAYICSSVPLCLNALTQNKMNRQLLFTYPSAGMILSRLAAMGFVPIPRVTTNGISVSSHLPVHLDSPHSSVKSKGRPASFARLRAPRNITDHGRLILCSCFLTWRLLLASFLLAACQSRLAAAALARFSGFSMCRWLLSLTLSGLAARYNLALSTMVLRYSSSVAYLSRFLRKYSGNRPFSRHGFEQYSWTLDSRIKAAPQIRQFLSSGVFGTTRPIRDFDSTGPYALETSQ